MQAKTKKILGTIFNTFSMVLMIIAIAMLAFVVVCKISNKTPQIFGYSFHFVVTDSMEDEIMVGDLVIGKKTDIMDIKAGDDIIFVSPDPSLQKKIIVHRVKSVDDTDGVRKLYTYGINNIKDDNPLYPVTSIIGKVSKVSTFWGKIFNPMTIIFIIIILLFLFFFHLSVKSFLKSKRELKEEARNQSDSTNIDDEAK